MGLQEVRLNPFKPAKPRVDFGRSNPFKPASMPSVAYTNLSEASGTLHRPLAPLGQGIHFNYLA